MNNIENEFVVCYTASRIISYWNYNIYSKKSSGKAQQLRDTVGIKNQTGNTTFTANTDEIETNHKPPFIQRMLKVQPSNGQQQLSLRFYPNPCLICPLQNILCKEIKLPAT